MTPSCRGQLPLPPYFLKKFIYFTFGYAGCCSAWAFSSCDERGLLFIAVRGLLIVVASLVAEHGL